MKTSITNERGINVERDGDGLYVNDQPLERAAFNNRWTDLFAELHEGSGPDALTYETYRDTLFPMRFFRSNQNDKIFMVYQMTHGWNQDYVIPHMHCIPMASGSGAAAFFYMYTWVPEGAIAPASTGWITGSVTASFSPADQYVHTKVSFGSVFPPTGSLGSSALLLFAVERRGSSPSDTYKASKPDGTGAANLGILFFDTHVQVLAAGTISELQ